jgi:hypothetical protein
MTAEPYEQTAPTEVLVLPEVPATVVEYVERVREQLGDLPPAELEEMVEETTSHLVEVASELAPDPSFGRLVGRLGRPQDYAAELRATAGYPEGPLGGARVTRLTDWRRRLADALASPRGVQVVELARELRPVWWVLRALVLLLGARWVATDSWVLPFSGFHVGLTEMVLALGAVSLSIWWGRRPLRTTLQRWVTVVLDVVAVLAVAASLVSVNAADPMNVFEPVPVPFSGAFDEYGTPIDNLYAFTPDGKAIPEFYLFDSNGVPFTAIPDGEDCAGSWLENQTNRFPRTAVTWDDEGECQDLGRTPPFAVSIVPSATPR